MNSPILSAFQRSIKPASVMLANNVDAMTKIAVKQTALITGMMKEGVKLTEQLVNEQDIKAVVGAGKASVGKAAQDVSAAFTEIKEILVVTTSKNGAVAKDVYRDAKDAVGVAATNVKTRASEFKDTVSEKAKTEAGKVTSFLSRKTTEQSPVVDAMPAPKKVRAAKAVSAEAPAAE